MFLSKKIQLTTIALCLSLSATVILCCLFLPKLRVVLLKPNKNVRSKNSKIKSAYNKNNSENKVTTSFRDASIRKKSINKEPPTPSITPSTKFCFKINTLIQ